MSDQNKPVECQNCDWKGTEDQVEELQDVSERVGPGETMPVGECPKCGAVAHYMDESDPKTPSPALLEAISDLEAILEDMPEVEPDAEDYDDMEGASSVGIDVGRYETGQAIKPVLTKLRALAGFPTSA
ncbi:hypothetical protein [Erythrobacter aureus]|uniref:Uncharacterized protein n=1 Tax=Erythrobacter aureus TaxID=2182384 RepID=A0A345YJE9_9SPHN|nr:hypothetical protein [Erythrobacter aureus]AXK44051.1 hypothetical protein DVR09_16490 [Erythrobacter aureus]